MTSITMPEIKAYFARQMNSIRKAEGHHPYTAEQIDACWDTMHEAERAEWEDEALGRKMDDRFAAWAASRVWHDNLCAALPHVADHFEGEETVGGYAYAFGCWVAYLGGTYWAPADRGDLTGDLATVERFVWDNHARYEV